METGLINKKIHFNIFKTTNLDTSELTRIFMCWHF